MENRVESQTPANQPGRSEGQGQAGSNAQQGMMRYTRLPSPFDLMRRFTEDVDRLLLSFVGDPQGTAGPFDPTNRAVARPAAAVPAPITWVPSVEVTTRGDDLVIAVDLPGVKPENVQVEAAGNNLIISGESHFEQEDKKEGYWYSERVYGTFYRSLPLPPGVNAENARADFKNGTLEITLPGAVKSLQPQRRSIAVQNAPPGTQPSPAITQPQGTAGTQGTTQQTAPANGQMGGTQPSAGT